MAESVRERLQNDMKDAMRARDQVALDTIRFVLSAIKNAEIDNRGPLSAEDEMQVPIDLDQLLDKYNPSPSGA